MKRLTKSRNNRLVSGVLGGIADYLGVDATILRIIYVALMIFTVVGPGVILYIALSIIIPEGTQETARDHRQGYYRSDNFSTKKERKEAEKVDEDWSDF